MTTDRIYQRVNVLFLDELERNYPKAYVIIRDWWGRNVSKKFELALISFIELPYALQFGIWTEFTQDSGWAAESEATYIYEEFVEKDMIAFCKAKEVTL